MSILMKTNIFSYLSISRLKFELYISRNHKTFLDPVLAKP